MNVPKKRGRKPKNKPDDENKSPKKRGRKPKPKNDDDIKSKIPKKRGRKPKEKIYGITKSITNDNNLTDQNIILHLPISITDLEKDYNENITSVEYQKIIDEPLPFEPTNNFQTIDSKSIEKISKDNDILQIDDGIEKKLVKRNIKNIMFEFIDGNNRKEWPQSTNIYCMWCCHPFDTIPCALPIKYINDVFYLKGCFCSFNCAAAYNFDKKNENIWERYSLLNLLYKKIYNTSFIKIKLAPPRETLKIFGGFLTINEFRNNFLMNKKYSIIMPPFISIIPKIEENIYEYTNKHPSYIPVDENVINTAAIKIKRSKPITNPKETLESYMALKIS